MSDATIEWEIKEFDVIFAGLNFVNYDIQRCRVYSSNLERLRNFILFRFTKHHGGFSSYKTANFGRFKEHTFNATDSNLIITGFRFWKDEEHFNKSITRLLNFADRSHSKFAYFVFYDKKNKNEIYHNLHYAISKREEYVESRISEFNGEPVYLLVNSNKSHARVFISINIVYVPKWKY